MVRKYRKPHRIQKKKSLLKSRFFWSLISSLIILGGGFYFLIFSDFFQVREIVIIGSERVAVDNIKAIAEGELGKKILFFETKSIFLVNSRKIREIVLQKFSQVADVEVKKSFPNVLNLVSIERKEIGVFCRENFCFLLDRQGVIFEQVPPEFPLLKFQNQTFSQELNLGEKMFDEASLNSILDIAKKLMENLSIPLKELSLVSADRLNVKTTEGWEIYFNVKKDLGWQIASLGTILEKSIPPEKRESLEYIDLRFDKIFVYPEL